MPGNSRRSLNKRVLICGKCQLNVEDSDQSIECDKCSKTFHVICTRLNKRQFDHLLDHDDEEFFCDFCVPNVNNSNSVDNSSVTAELSAMRAELKTELSAMRDTMNFMSKQYDDILRGVTENKKKIEAMQKENKALKAELSVMKASMKYMNDQRVQYDCLVTGLKATDNESAVDAVIKLSASAGVVMEPQSIADAYFLKKNDKNNQSAVVKFNSKKAKSNLMAIKPKLREKEETKKVFVNDFLSRETLSLYKYAKVLKNIGFRSIYTSGSKVFAKRSELSKPRLLRSEEEVDKIISEATTYQQQQRRPRQVIQPDEESENEYGSAT